MKPKKKKNFYRDFQKEILDPVSPSFCAAKWLNSTIWLGNGTTSSCHLPPPHAISTKGLAQNPSALHNTVHKKIARAEMLEGKRPSECEYCWKIEDLKKNNLSDRVFKSAAFSKHDIQRISKLPFDADVYPRTLEIAFDRTCNFACSYCSAAQSTKWASDLQKNGGYKGILTERAYRADTNWSTHKKPSKNPYMRAFWNWLPELVFELTELRVTGGEPLLSKQTWRLINIFSQNKKIKTRLAINTNLGHDDSLVDKLIAKSHNISELDLYISCESTGDRAEYIRDGLKYKKFIQNLEKIMKEASYRQMHMMLTISCLSILDITNFLDQMVRWKELYGDRAPRWTCNILRFPSFLSITILPSEIKERCIKQIRDWLRKNKNKPCVSGLELETLKRLINYLGEAERPYLRANSVELLRSDFKNFFEQYDKRRKKNLLKTFPEIKEWFKKIKKFKFEIDSVHKQSALRDSLSWYHDFEQLEQKAKSKGLQYPTKKEVTNE